MSVKLVPGFNPKCSNTEYHADRQFKSSSALKMILKNPREYYKKYVLNEKDTMNSDALSIGSYAHTRILEPHLVDEEFAIYEGKSRRGQDWKDFEEVNSDKIIMTKSQKYLVDKMIAEYEKSKIIIGNHGNEKEVPLSNFFNGGAAEETLCGYIDDYPVKCRFDYRKQFEDFGSINDLKTTGAALGSCPASDVQEICDYWGYHLSAALYADLAEQATGLKHDFYFIFLSKKDYAARIFKASDKMLERGRSDYKRAIAALKEAEATGQYFQNKVEELY